LDTRKHRRLLVIECVKPTASRRSIRQNENCCSGVGLACPQQCGHNIVLTGRQFAPFNKAFELKLDAILPAPL
jgi:hypothetical protein